VTNACCDGVGEELLITVTTIAGLADCCSAAEVAVMHYQGGVWSAALNICGADVVYTLSCSGGAWTLTVLCLGSGQSQNFSPSGESCTSSELGLSWSPLTVPGGVDRCGCRVQWVTIKGPVCAGCCANQPATLTATFTGANCAALTGASKAFSRISDNLWRFSGNVSGCDVILDIACADGVYTMTSFSGTSDITLGPDELTVDLCDPMALSGSVTVTAETCSNCGPAPVTLSVSVVE